MNIVKIAKKSLHLHNHLKTNKQMVSSYRRVPDCIASHVPVPDLLILAGVSWAGILQP